MSPFDWKERSTLNRALILVAQLVILFEVAATPGCTTELLEPAVRENLQNPTIVFNGTVLKMAPNPQPQTGSVLVVYQLAKYHVNRVCKGGYAEEEMVVDHLILDSKELEEVKVGDTVCITVERSDRIYTRWSYPGIREESDTVETYYVGGKVTLGTYADCDCSH